MRLLWLKTEFLHPLDKGGRIRTYQMLRALVREHDVTYACLDDGTSAPDAAERVTEYASRLMRVPFRPPTRGSLGWGLALARNLASPLPYAVDRYTVPEMASALEAAVQAHSIDVLVCDFLAPAANLRLPSALPTLLFQHNVEAEIWRRHAEVASRAVTARYFHLQWRRMERFEARVCRGMDHVVAVSAHDARLFRERYGTESVSVVETGVDTDYFVPRPATLRAPATIVFIGSMDWMPNEEGILFFVAQVLPLLRQRRPDVRLQVVGRRPSARLQRLQGEVSGVEVTGDVPDVRPFLAAATCTVVPLRVGGGTRLKIYEAMAMACPVVSTTIGAEGLPITPGEHFLQADEPAALAEACLSLIDDPTGAARMGDTASGHVRTRYAWQSVAGDFTRACEAARLRHASRPNANGTA